jgi:hypothetical protein
MINPYGLKNAISKAGVYHVTGPYIPVRRLMRKSLCLEIVDIIIKVDAEDSGLEMSQTYVL